MGIRLRWLGLMGGLTLGLMLAIPPWRQSVDGWDYALHRSLGYGWVWSPPDAPEIHPWRSNSSLIAFPQGLGTVWLGEPRIDDVLLKLEILLLLLIAVLVVRTQHPTPHTDTRTQPRLTSATQVEIAALILSAFFPIWTTPPSKKGMIPDLFFDELTVSPFFVPPPAGFPPGTSDLVSLTIKSPQCFEISAPFLILEWAVILAAFGWWKWRVRSIIS